jgi:hypothetical protein
MLNQTTAIFTNPTCHILPNKSTVREDWPWSNWSKMFFRIILYEPPNDVFTSRSKDLAGTKVVN